MGLTGCSAPERELMGADASFLVKLRAEVVGFWPFRLATSVG